jgi:ankyrin repeat protein
MMEFRLLALSLFLVVGAISLATSCRPSESSPPEEREADGLDKLVDAARQERGRELRELDVTKSLSHGADPNAATSAGNSTLGIAARWNLAEISRRLLAAGARVEGPDAD